MATLQIRHPALAAAIRSRPDLKTALAEDPHLVHHVTTLDLFLMALARDMPDKWLAERLVTRLLPSTQDLIAVRHRRDAMIRAAELGTTRVPVYTEGEPDDTDPHRWPDLS